MHKERKNFPKNGFKKYIANLKGKFCSKLAYLDIPSKGEIARQRRAIKAKQRKRPDVATLEMKLAKSEGRPGTAGPPKGLADLKLGMN